MRIDKYSILKLKDFYTDTFPYAGTFFLRYSSTIGITVWLPSSFYYLYITNTVTF